MKVRKLCLTASIGFFIVTRHGAAESFAARAQEKDADDAGDDFPILVPYSSNVPLSIV
jgi:hypothetical protein